MKKNDTLSLSIYIYVYMYVCMYYVCMNYGSVWTRLFAFHTTLIHLGKV